MSTLESRLQCVRALPEGAIQAACPICRAQGRDAKGQHLKIWPAKTFHCIADDSTPHVAAIRKYLKGGTIDDIEFIEPDPKLTEEVVYPENVLTKLIPDYTYWLGRGAREEVLKRLECGLAPKEERSKLSGRAVFPIRDMAGRLMGFSGRLVEPNSYAPNWKHMFKVSKAVYPWNISGPYIEGSKTCVIVESIGDMIALMGVGINNVICIFGLNMNNLIIGTLIAHDVRRVFVSLNNDGDMNKGNGAAAKIKRKLDGFISPENVIIRLSRAKDWGVATHDELIAFRNEITT